MAKIGSYYYPSRKIIPIIESVKLIGDKLRSNTASVEVVASTLGYKSTFNGAFQHTLADIRKYGLVDGRGKEIRLSELAHKIIAPNKGEEASAMKEMIFHMPLWKEIYEKFGKNPSDFSVVLQSVAGINRLEADAVKDEISKLYIDAVSKIGNEVSTENGGNMQIDNQNVGQSSEMIGNPQKFASFSSEGISIKILNDKSHLQTADSFIKFLLTQTEETNKSKKNKEEQ